MLCDGLLAGEGGGVGSGEDWEEDGRGRRRVGGRNGGEWMIKGWMESEMEKRRRDDRLDDRGEGIGSEGEEEEGWMDDKRVDGRGREKRREE